MVKHGGKNHKNPPFTRNRISNRNHDTKYFLKGKNMSDPVAILIGVSVGYIFSPVIKVLIEKLIALIS